MKTKALQTAPTLFVAESKMKTAVLAKSSRPGKKKVRSSPRRQNHPFWRDGLRGFYDAQRPCAQSFLSSAPSQRKLGRPRDSWILGSLDSVEQKDNRRVHKRSASSGHRRTFLVYEIKLAEPNSWFCPTTICAFKRLFFHVSLKIKNGESSDIHFGLWPIDRSQRSDRF